MVETTKQHENDGDHEVWIRCFTAALTGAVASGKVRAEANKPHHIAKSCAEFADAALIEERQRLCSAISYFVTGRIRGDRSGGLRINVRANICGDYRSQTPPCGGAFHRLDRPESPVASRLERGGARAIRSPLGSMPVPLRPRKRD